MLAPRFPRLRPDCRGARAEVKHVDQIGGFTLPRFKLGTDLAGGTILVYEIDTRKLIAEGDHAGIDPKSIAPILAEKLKKRIDPNDLYNVVIRPAGGEGRVEIILPTGSTVSADKYKQAWDNLLTQMEEKYKLEKGSLKVPRGQSQRLVDKILQTEQQKIWEQLFATPQSKQELIERALDPIGKDFKEEPQDMRPCTKNGPVNDARLSSGPAWSSALAPMGRSPRQPRFTARFCAETKTLTKLPLISAACSNNTTHLPRPSTTIPSPCMS